MAIELVNILEAISLLGLIFLLKPIFSFLKWIWVMFLRPPKNLQEYGKWVIITGSTDGIGKALAFELASKGLNLVLVGRNPSKLEATSNEIHQKYGDQVDIKNIVIDFAKCKGEEISKSIEKGIEGLDIGVLINNAGLAYPYPMFFNEVDLELMDSIMKVNIDGATWVTKSVLPVMLKKKKGAIVNIGSGSGALSSYPLYSIYAATKAYLAMFSRCISLEYKKQGVDVQCQIPLLVTTKMSKLKKPSLFIPSPETYSKASIRCIGHERLCIPYWAHSMQWFLLCSFPDSLLDLYILRNFIGIRKRALNKF
ncbi:adh_short domain-containing protein [Cephalotus follicularis]|uniref:Adh_short domain-containing protein n=1 Tax=Cephalotus follicularis TaxID=3775 RepID=A0A1Q3AW98_CEPFO|nr:adh_short domain-containing protein [Cephalotus follicularis]